MLALKALSWVLLLLQPCFANLLVDGYHKARQLKEDRQNYLQQRSPKTDNSSCNSPSCYRYYNSKTEPFFIESWPDVDFDTGEFYGGSIPIDESDPSRTLFFIFKPAEVTPVDEVAIWLNGGPGCSSLEGFFQENGPILWQPGTLHPVKNEWAWSKLTNLLWVEQPVGTGFAQGKVTAHNEVDIAKDFLGFFENWQKLFGIQDYKIYLTGESYAGRYVPYIGAQMLEQKDTTYFDFSGALIYDPCIGDCNWVQRVYPTYYFALNNNQILNLPESALAELQRSSENCGYNAYLDKYLQFPPPGIQPPPPGDNVFPNASCDVSYPYSLALHTNPCYYCPLLYNPLSTPEYFNRADVKEAIHAPPNVTWYICTIVNVFLNGDRDQSPDANLAVLPQIIEATNRVLISNGDWDGLIFTNGTLLAIQNMTWSGALGFQSAPSQDFVVTLEDSYQHFAQGVMGKQHYERGLQWVETYQAGHQQPQYQPRAAYRHLQWVLGRIDSL